MICYAVIKKIIVQKGGGFLTALLAPLIGTFFSKSCDKIKLENLQEIKIWSIREK